MAYIPNTPAVNTAANQTRKPIEDNFIALAPWGFGYGQFTLQSAAPSFGTGIDGMYVLNNATTTKNELYIHKQTFAGTSDIPFTASILSKATPVANSDGWTNLPSGIRLVWSSFSSATGLTTVTLPGGIPPFTVLLNVFLTPVSSSTSDADFAVRLVDILSPTQFRVYVSKRTTVGAGTGGAKVLAIGY